MTKTNRPTPRTIRAFEEKPRKEDKKTSSVDYETTKASDLKSSNSNKNFDRNTTNQKRGKCGSFGDQSKSNF